MQCQTAAHDRLGLTRGLWLSLCLLKTQQLCSHSNGWYNLPSASHLPPTPTPPPSHPPNPLPPARPLYTEFVILMEFRKMSQNPAALARWLN